MLLCIIYDRKGTGMEETDHISEAEIQKAYEAGYDQYPKSYVGLETAIKQKILQDAFKQGWKDAREEAAKEDLKAYKWIGI